MTVINTNTAALTAQYHLSQVNKEMEQAMERLSSGQRINSASDDAAGLAIASKMDAQIRGLNTAIRNANDGINLANTAEGAMEEVENMLQRMREIAVQSANGTYSASDRANLDAEVQELKAEIDRVVNTTRWNDIVLLDGSYSGSMQIGAKANETLAVTIGNMATTSLGTSSTAASTAAATSNSASGKEAIVTTAQMAFNGNDSYGFTLTVGNGSGGTVALSVAAGSVTGGDAQDVKDKLQTAIDAAVNASPPTLGSGDITVSANGNVLTINNNLGDTLAVSAFTSTANGTASYSSISGAGTSKLLDNDAAVTSISNNGGGAKTNATGTLTLDDDKDYSFRVNGTLVNITNLNGTGGTTMANALTAIQNAIGAGAAASTVAANGGSTAAVFSLQDSTGKNIDITNFTAASAPAGSAGSMVMTVRVDAGAPNTASNTYANGGSDTTDIETTDIVQLSFTEAEANYQFTITGAAGAQVYTVQTASAGKTLSEALAITRDAINTNVGTEKVRARVVDGKLELENEHTAAVTLDTFSSTGKAAVTAGAATLGATNLVTQGSASTTNGVLATTSQMSMQFTQDDNYSFAIGGTTITAAVSGGNLDAMVSAVNSNSSTTGVSARQESGLMMLENASGAAINITAFSSTGTGEAFVANAAGQGGSATLTDTAAVTGANTAAAGKATATTMDLTMSASDDVTFQISDGRTTAVVRKTTFNPANNAAIIAEITAALNAVGSDISVAAGADVTATGNGTADEKLILTNSKGGKIEITGFTSDGTGTMTATPATGQGVGKILNDDGISGSQAAVSAIVVTDQNGAQAAVGTIDRAIEQLNKERSGLGAITNRLDHTINNLSNVSTQVSASKSQIEDADFAAETSNLTKNQILSQAATSMLAQANQSKQGILALLQG